MTVRVRFAPSPTGYFHVGGARTALFNYLFARHCGGHFILRIEDTDRARYDAQALRGLFEDMKWLGLQWDEGPVGVDSAVDSPYFQSNRLEYYHRYVQQLLESGKAYKCWCTAERLEQIRAIQGREKQQIGYDRRCRFLSGPEKECLESSNARFVVRFAMETDGETGFEDMIRGRISWENCLLDDMVILKTDRYPTYHLANIVDDHLMDISHVLRGDEWISSTPRHVQLYRALGWTPPLFAHLPVILSPDGGKLSKRKGAASVTDYKNLGYLPDALLNFLALLGWAPGNDKEIMSLDEIIQIFSLQRISPKSCIFDEKKLEWINGHYLRERSVESLLPEVMAHWKEMGLLDPTPTPEFLGSVVALMKDRVRKTVEIAQSSLYFFRDPVEYENKASRKYFTEKAPVLLEMLAGKIGLVQPFDHVSLEALFRDTARELGISAGDVIHPTRLAVSGVSHGPGLFELLELLGQETVCRRMNMAAGYIKTNLVK